MLTPKKLEKFLFGEGFSQKTIFGFNKLYQQYLASLKQNDKNSIINQLAPLQFDDKLSYKDLKKPLLTEKLLQELVVCRFNGGLGTSMQCTLPKSSISVTADKNFLDLAIDQLNYFEIANKTSLPLLLMNSFYTTAQTKLAIKKYNKPNLQIFEQSCYPRLAENLKNGDTTPLSKKELGIQACYPPGHGDFFLKFQDSGLLKKFISQGKKYLFLSNIDNLGALVDFTILNYLAENDCPFLMEVTKKLQNDIKGGSLLKNKTSNRIKLVETAELAQLSQEQLNSLKGKLNIFNTNNIWINLISLEKQLKQKSWRLDLVQNRKKIAGRNILQLETIIGSAISNFKQAKLLEVPRDRFIPVKKVSDLLLVRSNLFKLNKSAGFKFQEQKPFQDFPQLDLGDINSISQFEKSFAFIPDILDLKSLSLQGEIYFSKGIKLKGRIVIKSKKPYTVSSGTVLEDKTNLVKN